MLETKEPTTLRLFKNPGTVLSMFFETYYKAKKCYQKNEKAPNILLKDVRDIGRLCYIWPDAIALKKQSYVGCTAFIVFVLFIHWATIFANLSKSYNDIVAFGENLSFLMGITLIFFKAIIILKNCTKIDEIFNGIFELHERHAGLKNERIVQIQRLFFISETGLFLFFSGSAFILTVTLIIQPIFTEQSIPLPAFYPFNLQDPQKHPLGVKFVYGFQALAVSLGLLLLLIFDDIGVCCITQTAENLRILCVRLRELGTATGAQNQKQNFWSELRELVELHQYIINLVDQINEGFYFTFLMQAFASTFIIGTAGFEALLSLDDTMIAFKFVFFMLIAMLQLGCWCMIGNIVYYDSQEVAVAAFQAHEWFSQSPAIQRNLMFVILRAQKPLEICAQPFLPFTMETYTKIIKLSYTSFTILGNSLE